MNDKLVPNEKCNGTRRESSFKPPIASPITYTMWSATLGIRETTKDDDAKLIYVRLRKGDYQADPRLYHQITALPVPDCRQRRISYPSRTMLHDLPKRFQPIQGIVCSFIISYL